MPVRQSSGFRGINGPYPTAHLFHVRLTTTDWQCPLAIRRRESHRQIDGKLLRTTEIHAGCSPPLHPGKAQGILETHNNNIVKTGRKPSFSRIYFDLRNLLPQKRFLNFGSYLPMPSECVFCFTCGPRRSRSVLRYRDCDACTRICLSGSTVPPVLRPP